MYSHNIRASKYIKQILTEMKADTDSNTVTVGDFNTPLSTMDISSRQNQWVNNGLEQHYRTSGLNRHT